MSVRFGASWLLVLAALQVLACSDSSTIGVEQSILRVAGTACLRPILATAVVIDEQRVLTVAHAVAGADDLHLVDSGGIERQVSVVHFDSERDLVLLAVDGLEASKVEMGDAEQGDMGRIMPISADLEIEPLEYHVRRLVNARSGDIYDQGEVMRNVLDIDVVTQPGDSGAPLIDDSGAMVGILFARSVESEGSWALASDEIESFLASSEGTTDLGRCR